MGFLAPAVPWILKGGAAIGSSLLGSKLAGGSGGVKDAKGLLDTQRANISQGQNIASGLQPQASNLLNLATQSYSPVANYWSRLLGGSRGEAMSSMQPEVSRINEGYNTAQTTASNLMPRGGGRSAFFSQLPFDRQRDITSLFQSARPQAASELLRVGSTAGGAGQGLYNTILNALGGAQSGTSSLLGYDLQSREAQYGRGKDIGRTIFDLLKMLPLDKIGKSGKSGIGLSPEMAG